MARLRIETAPEITVYDESFVIKAASGASASLAEFKNSSGTVVTSVSAGGNANLDSPALTGVPTAPTANYATSTTQIATTAFVRSEVAALVGTAGATLDTLGEIATALGNDVALSTTLTTSIGLKAPTASPTFTGVVTIPNGASIGGFATLASPALSGSPTAPTQSPLDNSTKIASTNYADLSANAAAGVVNTFVQTNYLTTNTAGSTYLTQAGATSTYLSISDASSTYLGKSLADVKGDLIVASANDTFGRLPVGADGNFLRANSSATSGLEWGSIPTINDIDDVGGVTITSVASGQFLKYNGSAWVNSSLTETLGITDLSDVTITTVAANQLLAYNGSAWVNTSDPTVAGNLIVSGNLTVSGTTTTINTETLTIDDNIIVLNNNEAGTPSVNAGIEVERGTSTNVVLRWNETTDCWEFTNDGTNYQRIFTDTVTNAQTASYTLVLADSGKMVEMGVASGNTLTIPPNSSVAFPVGTTLTVLQTGAGQCTLTAGAGVTVNGTPGLKLRTTWASATLIKRATDTWVALGDLVA